MNNYYHLPMLKISILFEVLFSPVNLILTVIIVHSNQSIIALV